MAPKLVKLPRPTFGVFAFVPNADGSFTVTAADKTIIIDNTAKAVAVIKGYEELIEKVNAIDPQLVDAVPALKPAPTTQPK